MFKKKVLSLILVLIVMLSLFSCPVCAATGLESFSGKTIGVQLGTIFDAMVLEYIPDAKLEYYNTNADLALALKTGKIDAYIADQPMARLLCETFTDQEIVGVFENCAYAYCFPKTLEESEKLCGQMNQFLKKIKENGTLKEIDAIWFGSDESKKVVDTSSLTGENGTLDFAMISAVGAPFTYIKDNACVGYDVDMAVRFCKEYGYKINIVDCNVGAFFANIATGQVDFGAASVCVTEERKETMNFSDANYDGSVVLVGKSVESKKEKTSFIKTIIESFEKTFIREERWKLFASGIAKTLILTLSSLLMGSLLGFAVFLIYRKKKKLFNGVVDAISSFLQLTPVVVILLICYYLIFAKLGLSGLVVSIIGFTLMFSCSIVKLLDTACMAVDPGQALAVRALGYKDTKGFIRIILPQAFPHFVPGYKGEIVALIKSTSIVSYVTVQDLTMVTDIIRSRTYDAFFPLISAAIIYFCFALLLIKIVDLIEIKTDPYNRSEEQILKGVKK